MAVSKMKSFKGICQIIKQPHLPGLIFNPWTLSFIDKKNMIYHLLLYAFICLVAPQHKQRRHSVDHYS